MATRRTTKSAETTDTTPAAETTTSTLEAKVTTRKKKRKKKKRRYSHGTRDLQRLERGGIRAAARIANAVADGLDDFYRRSDRSSRHRRDGMMIDLAENASHALEITMRGASRAPRDLARQLPTRRMWRQARNLITPFGFLR